MRPLPRSRVDARREVPFREDGTNQRWYRVMTPSVRSADGGLFILEMTERSVQMEKITLHYLGHACFRLDFGQWRTVLDLSLIHI